MRQFGVGESLAEHRRDGFIGRIAVGAHIPLDDDLFQGLVGAPPTVGNDGDEIAFAHHLLHAAHLLGGAGVVALACFIAIEARLPHPLLALKLFRNRHFSLAIVSAMLSFTVLFGVILLIPFYLDRVLGLPPSRIGLVMLAIPSSILVVSPLAGWLSDQVGARVISTLGLSVSTLGVFLLTTIQAATSPLMIAGQLLLVGLGQALFLSPNSASVLSQVEAEKTGAAAALLATARNLGMLLGIAQAALIFSLFFRGLTNGLDLRDFQPEHAAAFLTSLHGALLGAVLTGLLGTAASWFRGNSENGN